jgi:hypothetical protein
MTTTRAGELLLIIGVLLLFTQTPLPVALALVVLAGIILSTR